MYILIPYTTLFRSTARRFTDRIQAPFPAEGQFGDPGQEQQPPDQPAPRHPFDGRQKEGHDGEKGREEPGGQCPPPVPAEWLRSEEHTSELQSLMRISYAVFCLKKKKNTRNKNNKHTD